jgi:hypothetical protein
VLADQQILQELALRTWHAHETRIHARAVADMADAASNLAAQNVATAERFVGQSKRPPSMKPGALAFLRRHGMQPTVFDTAAPETFAPTPHLSFGQNSSMATPTSPTSEPTYLPVMQPTTNPALVSTPSSAEVPMPAPTGAAAGAAALGAKRCSAGCIVWFDGCNDCVCHGGVIGTCTFNPDCIVPGAAVCKRGRGAAP